MKRIRKVLYWPSFLLIVCCIGWLVNAGIHSGWHYGLVNGHVMRAWCVRLPGYEEHFDFKVSPPSVREEFSMHTYYRIGPWVKNVDDIEEAHVSPNGVAEGTNEYAAEEWLIHQGLTIPLQVKTPHTYQGMLQDYFDSRHETP